MSEAAEGVQWPVVRSLAAQPSGYGRVLADVKTCRRILYLLILVACSATALACPPSNAAQWRVKRQVVGGPTFAGGGVAWFVARPDVGTDLYEGSQSGKANRIQAFPAPPPRSNSAPEVVHALVGSRQFLTAFIRPRYVDPSGFEASTENSDVFAGAMGSPLPDIEHCDPSLFPSLRGIDASVKTIVFPRCDNKLVVRDMSGAQPDQVVGSTTHGGRVSGRYVAWLEGPYSDLADDHTADVVVYDRVTKAIVYHVPRSGIPGRVQSLSVQSDGKVAISIVRVGSGRLEAFAGWASPQAPRFHRLPLATRGQYTVSMASNLIAFGRDARNDSHAEVGVANLKGRSHLIAVGTVPSSEIDFDGHNVVFLRRCHKGGLIQTSSFRTRAKTGENSHC